TGVRRSNLNTAGTGARGGAVAQALAWAPTTPVRDALGNYVLEDPISSLFYNPVALTTEMEARQERTTAILLTGLNYEVLPGLTVDAQLGLNYSNRQDKYYSGDVSADTDIASASRSSNEDLAWQSTNTVNYRKSFGIHAFDITGVFEAQQMTSNGFGASVNDLTYPSTKYDNLALAASNSVYSGYSQWSLLSLVGRVNYALKDRYLLSASVRRDGSSKFQGDNRYSTFPAVALGWRLSEESFMQDIKFVTNLKLRGSWGLTGAQGISPYGTLSAYSTNVDDASAVFDGTSPGTITSGIILANPGNAGLKWETTEQIDIGADFEVAQGRVSLSVDYFKKTTDDLHLLRPLPGYAGGYSIQSNIGSNENTGWEFALSAVPLQVGQFQWRTTFNVSLLKNEITNLGTDRDTIPMSQFQNVLITGQSMSAIWGYKFLGTYKPADAAEAEAYGRTPGDARYEDTNGDGVISAADYQIIGTGVPKTSLGFNNTFTYKNLSLNIFFQGLFGFDKQNYSYAYGMIGSTDAKEIIFEDIKGRYIPGTNETSEIPKFGGHPLNSEARSSRFVEQGDFLRLKNVSLAYTVPRTKLQNIADIRIFVSGTNLLTFSSYKGIDPESNSNSVSGLTWDNIGTDAQVGLDYGSYPNSKTYTMGFNVTF
ncbi:MAG TPA: SusC/RagA family TonB-linked outer membrane protein, partial [Chryseolinea sp.]|nr:SusC/RagA family TonB-linked outer membrane protein [Chryseolinea sp.]